MVRVELVSHCDLGGASIQGLLDTKSANDYADDATYHRNDDDQSDMAIVHAFNLNY